MSDPNRAAYREGTRGHVESWFIRVNEPNGRRALWLKWTIFADGTAPPRAECWAVAFERGRAPRGGKRSFALEPDSTRDDPFRVSFAGNTFDGTHAEGRVRTASCDIVFGADLTATAPRLQHLPYEWMYRARLPEFKMVSPIFDASARGFYVIDGERVDITGWRAMQGHNWGVRHAHRYAWCHGFAFDGAADVVFEGFSGRLKKAGVELPWLSIAHLWVDGVLHRFDAPIEIARADADARVMHWRLSTRAGDVTLDAEASADTHETAALLYANPGAPATNCLNSKLGSLRVTLRERDRVRSWETRQAAFEVGWPSADHGVLVVA